MLALAVVVGVLAALWPAMRAARLPLLDAITSRVTTPRYPRTSHPGDPQSSPEAQPAHMKKARTKP